MATSKLSDQEIKGIENAIIAGDAAELEQFLRSFKDDLFVIDMVHTLIPDPTGKLNYLENARAIISNRHHFSNWEEFEKFLSQANTKDSPVRQFEKAIDAVITGDSITLTKLLQQNPALLSARSLRDHHAMLLHYTGANGVEDFRQKTPSNAVDITEVLLKAGAEVDAMGDMYGGTTTLGLVATSIHPAKAGVQKRLIDLFLHYGADMNHSVASNYTEGNLVVACLHNGRGEAAAYLAEKGAILNLEGAAGTGILDKVKTYYNKGEGLLKDSVNIKERDLGFMWACEYGHINVVDFMLQQGFDLATQVNGMTALHWAAIGKQLEIIKVLLDRHAPLEIKNQYGGTVLGQAIWSAYNDPKPGDSLIIKTLIDAGAIIDTGWKEFIDNIPAP